ncbi:pyridoxal-dependent decarboxylase [Asanoa sp. NPDC049518]|uniref:pyridoxal phosphate-dependent decarboxylase family protein n=1 Tax=unclassified Asanoa TaxID=2685164 RepID=UPI003447E47F
MSLATGTSRSPRGSAGLGLCLVVGSAGTTDTGTIDPLRRIAALAAREDLWFHVDAAYGGFFRLTDRGRARLTGTELADSVTLDPHKTLFLPFGTGALVVRDPAKLAAAHEGTADYLRAVPLLEVPWLPDLSTVAFRVRAADGDAAAREVLSRVNASQRVYLSSTVVGGRQTLRVTVVAHRSHAPQVEEAIALITAAAAAVGP